ncbi:hypothetical protein AGMMS4952_23570 [Spirochaetia bacterium]|nr:hypothetical protein AGMMS4952_23570 [Spirochaetia bacterium]
MKRWVYPVIAALLVFFGCDNALYTGEVGYVRDFLTRRISWMDANL